MKKQSNQKIVIKSFAEYLSKFFPSAQRSEEKTDNAYQFGEILAKQTLAKNRHLLQVK